MAKAATAPAKSRATPLASGKVQAKAKHRSSGWLLLALLIPLCLAVLPSTMIFMVGMLPTFVAQLTDRDPEKMASLTVGLVNGAALSPILFDLWTSGHDIANAIHMLHQPYVWLLMYGGAGVGWMLHLGVPPVIAAMVALKARTRIKFLEGRQQALVEEWGVDLKTGDKFAAVVTTEDDEEDEGD